MSARQTFWGSPEIWPNDSASYIFLARAILALGKSIYGSEWTDAEVTVEHVRLSSINLLDDVYLNNFLAKHGPNSERKHVGPVGSSSFQRIHSNGLVEEAYAPENPISITVDDRISALSLVEKLKLQNAPAIERVAQVQNEFVKLAESEKLLTAYRDINGGDQVEIPRVWWNTEKLQCRFSNCQIEPSDPFNNQESGSAWIYVSRRSLENVTGELIAPPTRAKLQSSGSQSELSEVMKPRLTKAQKRELFQKWRASKGEYVPTLAEDTEYMKAQGVSRNDVRKLRTKFPRRLPGRKKKITVNRPKI
jgi:hypothetical protein